MIIYKATNIVNGKVYIGQTKNSLEYRKSQHFRETKSSAKKNTYFHNAIQKYGKDSFIFEEIDSAETIEELNIKEEYWISYYNSTNKDIGYNLDSGGKNCTKSESTKRKIGDTTLEKWNDPETAQKMLDGLRKGTELWKQISKEKLEKFVCPYCGKVMFLPKWEADKKNCCSNECKRIHGGYTELIHKASEASAIINHERNLERKKIIAEDILCWADNNVLTIVSCQKNKIESGLSDLMTYIYKKYGIKDMRTLFICFSVKNKKEFLQYLINYVSKENVC